MELKEGFFKVGSYKNTFYKLIVDQKRGKMMLQEREGWEEGREGRREGSAEGGREGGIQL